MSLIAELEHFQRRHARSLRQSRLRLTRAILVIKLVVIVLGVHYISVVNFKPYWFWQFNLAIFALLCLAGTAFSFIRYTYLSEPYDRDKGLYRLVALIVMLVGWAQVGVSQERWMNRVQGALQPLVQRIDAAKGRSGYAQVAKADWVTGLPLIAIDQENAFRMRGVGAVQYFPRNDFFLLQVKHSLIVYHTYDSRVKRWQQGSALKVYHRTKQMRSSHERTTSSQTL